MADDIKILQAPDVRILQQVLSKALETSRAGGVTVWVVSIGQVIVGEGGNGNHAPQPQQIETKPLVLTATEQLPLLTTPISDQLQSSSSYRPHKGRTPRIVCTREQIIEALEQCQWKRVTTAAMLGIKPNTLNAKMYNMKIKNPERGTHG